MPTGGLVRCGLILIAWSPVVRAGGGGDRPALFEMGGKLSYAPVAAMLALVITFTYTAKKGVRRVKSWVEDFNPLLQPVVEKTISELMILGACAFALMLVNENTNQSLANGSVMPVNWYHTLHWIDTTIFVWALVYIAAACFLLWYCEWISNWLNKIDSKAARVLTMELQDVHGIEMPDNEQAQSKGGARTCWQKFCLRQHLQYVVLKQHFLQASFGLPDMDVSRFDFVCYIETVMVFRITDAFAISIWDWLVLLFACMLVVEDGFGLLSTEIFTLCCFGLLSVSVAVVAISFYMLGKIPVKQFDINDKGDMQQVLAPFLPNDDSGNSPFRSTAEISERTGIAVSSNMLAETNAAKELMHRRHHAALSHPHEMHHDLHNEEAPAAATPEALLKERMIFLGMSFSKRQLHNVVAWQLQVSCFYVAVHICGHIHLYMSGKMKVANFWLALVALMGNILIVMPIMMLVCYRCAPHIAVLVTITLVNLVRSLTGVSDADVKAFHQIGHRGKEAKLALQYLKIIVVNELDAQKGAAGETRVGAAACDSVRMIHAWHCTPQCTNPLASSRNVIM